MHSAKRIVWLVFVAVACALRAEESANEQSARLLRLEKFVVPEFPSFSRLNGVSRGSVAVAIGHDAAGRPADVLVLETSNVNFTRAALDAVEQWKFAPAAAGEGPRGLVPVVRFLFTARGVSVATPLVDVARNPQPLRADAPISLPNLDQLDARPKALNQPMPALASAKGEAGLVTVKYFVDAEGRARVPTVMEASSPELAAAALAAVAQWRFEPPRLGGKRVIALDVISFRPKTAAGS